MTTLQWAHSCVIQHLLLLFPNESIDTSRLDACQAEEKPNASVRTPMTDDGKAQLIPLSDPASCGFAGRPLRPACEVKLVLNELSHPRQAPTPPSHVCAARLSAVVGPALVSAPHLVGFPPLLDPTNPATAKVRRTPTCSPMFHELVVVQCVSYPRSTRTVHVRGCWFPPRRLRNPYPGSRSERWSESPLVPCLS